MYGYNVHEALYLICEVHGPWVRGSGPRAGLILPQGENVLI